MFCPDEKPSIKMLPTVNMVISTISPINALRLSTNNWLTWTVKTSKAHSTKKVTMLSQLKKPVTVADAIRKMPRITNRAMIRIRWRYTKARASAKPLGPSPLSSAPNLACGAT